MRFILIPVSFLLVFISSISSETVFDINGRPLTAGSLYNIVPAVPTPNGGGITVVPTPGQQQCPRVVGQDPSSNSNGRPVVFRQNQPNADGNIHTSTIMTIRFGFSMVCGYTPIWQVGAFSQPLRTNLVENNGRDGSPSCQTFTNWFKIERFNTNPPFYKLVWDPTSIGSSCGGTPLRSADLDIFDSTGNLLLGVTTGTSPPFYVRFAPFTTVGDSELPGLAVPE